MNKMNKKDRDSLTGLIMKFLDQLEFEMVREERILRPVFDPTIWDEVYGFIKKKLSWLEDTYEEEDIIGMIVYLARVRLLVGRTNEDFSDGISRVFDERASEIDDELEKFLEEQPPPGDDYEARVSLTAKIDIENARKGERVTEEFHRKAVNDTIEELEDPTRSYALVQLPNVELRENISITDSLFLLTNTEEDSIEISIPESKRSHFALVDNSSYLLIEVLGFPIDIFGQRSPLVYKNIMTKLKAFLGLSVISNVLTSRKHLLLSLTINERQIL